MAIHDVMKVRCLGNFLSYDDKVIKELLLRIKFAKLNRQITSKNKD